MKFFIVFIACLLRAFIVAEEHKFIHWSHIKPLNLHVEPIGPAPEVIGTRIIGGSIAPLHAFPYQVALFIDDVHFCGGSIISNEWVLTAAHCVDTANQVRIVAGAQIPFINESTQVKIDVVNRVVHSGWNRKTGVNDIALLRTTHIPIGSVGIDRIDLAPANAGTFAGTQAVLTGWGRTNSSSSFLAYELRNITLPIITNQVCQNSFGAEVKDSNICTSGAGGVGPCNGDSGSPLVVDGVDVGLVSFGTGNCMDGHPNVYTRVSFYRNWIRNNTGV